MVSKRKLASGRPIRRQSVAGRLAESLRERILSGDLKEGAPLIQDEIARKYRASRMPVREALRQLEASGLVAMHVHRGAVVTSVPTEQIAELFELRALLECDILARAIPRMTAAHLAETQSVLNELEASYRRHDIASWGHLNWEFHRSLYAPANRVRTLAILQSINLQTDRYIRLHLLLTHGLEAAEREHGEILRLCQLRDTERAVRYLRKHILNTSRNLLVALQDSRSAAVA